MEPPDFGFWDRLILTNIVLILALINWEPESGNMAENMLVITAAVTSHVNSTSLTRKTNDVIPTESIAASRMHGLSNFYPLV